MNEIATIDVSTELKPFRDKLAEFKSQFDNVVYDLNDETQNKQARSDRLTVGKVISALDAKHKEVKAPLQVAVKLVDGERKEIKDDLLEVQGKIKRQIDTHEAAIKQRSDAILERINELRELVEFYESRSSEEIAERLAEAESFVLDDDLGDHKGWAAISKTETIEALKKLHIERVKHETEQAELTRLREEQIARERAEREEQIRQDAEAKAKREAQKAVDAAESAKLLAEQEAEHAAIMVERKAQEAVEAAEESKRLAEKRAKDAAEAAERRVIEAAEAAERAKVRAGQEAKAAAERAATAERERIEREQRETAQREAEAQAKEDKRKSRQAHRNKIHKAAKEALVRVGIGPDTAMKIVELIKNGDIAHVGIEY